MGCTFGSPINRSRRNIIMSQRSSVSEDRPPNAKRAHDGSRKNSDQLFRQYVDADVPPDYVSFVFHKDLLPSVTRFFEAMTQDMTNKSRLGMDEPRADPKTTVDSKTREFLNDFTHLKEDLMTNLHEYSDSDLKKEVNSDNFQTFKEQRKILSRWYICGQHLLKKLTSESTAKSYLTLNPHFSPAVRDDAVKSNTLSTIEKCRKNLEDDLTEHVLDKALSLTRDVRSMYETTAVNDRSTEVANKILMKAFRVVMRTNQHLEGQHEEHSYSRPIRGTSARIDFESSRNRVFSHRRRRGTFHDDYPPVRRENYDYRRFKRRPRNWRRPSRNFEDFENEDDDEVFHPPRRPPFRRNFRPRRWRNNRY